MNSKSIVITKTLMLSVCLFFVVLSFFMFGTANAMKIDGVKIAKNVVVPINPFPLRRVSHHSNITAALKRKIARKKRVKKMNIKMMKEVVLEAYSNEELEKYIYNAVHNQISRTYRRRNRAICNIL